MLAPESQMTWYVELLLLASRNRWGDCKAARRTAALSAAQAPMFTIVMLQWVAIFFAEVCCLCVHCELPIPCTPAAGFRSIMGAVGAVSFPMPDFATQKTTGPVLPDLDSHLSSLIGNRGRGLRAHKRLQLSLEPKDTVV